jgi:molybdopterin synthase catalytic subunit
MANLACKTLVTQTPLAAPPLDGHDATGAAADFWGIVRGSEDGRSIEGIDYEAHRQMAEHQLKQIAIQAARQFRLNDVVIHHRIGFIAVGEPSLFVRVCTPHRQEAFRACEWVVDELKKSVPIWKRPRFKGNAAVDGVVDVGLGLSMPATTKAATV